MPYMILAAISPRKKVTTVAAHVVASEIISGDGSIGRITMQQL
jgi:hypothetical protein